MLSFVSLIEAKFVLKLENKTCLNMFQDRRRVFDRKSITIVQASKIVVVGILLFVKGFSFLRSCSEREEIF